jgi:hypothetical protein
MDLSELNPLKQKKGLSHKIQIVSLSVVEV